MGQAKNRKAEIEALKASGPKATFASAFPEFAEIDSDWKREINAFHSAAKQNVDLSLAVDPIYSKVVKSTSGFGIPGMDMKVAFYPPLRNAEGRIATCDIIIQVTDLKTGKSLIRPTTLHGSTMEPHIEAAAQWVLECQSLIIGSLMKSCFIGNRDFFHAVD